MSKTKVLTITGICMVIICIIHYTSKSKDDGYSDEDSKKEKPTSKDNENPTSKGNEKPVPVDIDYKDEGILQKGKNNDDIQKINKFAFSTSNKEEELQVPENLEQDFPKTQLTNKIDIQPGINIDKIPIEEIPRHDDDVYSDEISNNELSSDEISNDEMSSDEISDRRFANINKQSLSRKIKKPKNINGIKYDLSANDLSEICNLKDLMKGFFMFDIAKDLDLFENRDRFNFQLWNGNEQINISLSNKDLESFTNKHLWNGNLNRNYGYKNNCVEYADSIKALCQVYNGNERKMNQRCIENKYNRVNSQSKENENNKSTTIRDSEGGSILGNDELNTNSVVNTNKLESKTFKQDINTTKEDSIENPNKSSEEFLESKSLNDLTLVGQSPSSETIPSLKNFGAVKNKPDELKEIQNKREKTKSEQLVIPENKILRSKNIELIKKDTLNRNVNLKEKVVIRNSGSPKLPKDISKIDKENIAGSKFVSPKLLKEIKNDIVKNYKEINTSKYYLLGKQRWSNNNIEILKKQYPMLKNNMCVDLYNSLCILHEIDDNFLELKLVIDHKNGRDIQMSKTLKKRLINLMKAIRSGLIPKEMKNLYEHHANILNNLQVANQGDKIIFKDLSYQEKTIMTKNSQFINFIINKILPKFNSNMKSINKRTIETEIGRITPIEYIFGRLITNFLNK